MAEIEKIAVYDSRIIQDPPKYAVQKGALSVSTSTFQANAANAQQLSFQILVPSLNVFTDRKIELNGSAYVYSEAVPSQYVTDQVANPTAVPPIVGGQYIMQASDQFLYKAQETPISGMYQPSGLLSATNSIGGLSISGGNSACILQDNAWPGLVSTRGVVVDETIAEITVTQVMETYPLTISGNPADPAATHAYTAVANPFAKFAAIGNGLVTGTFQVDVDIRGNITPLSNYAGYVYLECQLRDPVSLTVYATTTFNAVMNGINYTTPQQPYVVAIGSAPITLTNSTICTIPNLQWFVTAVNAGVTPANAVWSVVSGSIQISGFELNQVIAPQLLNTYQSIGASTDLSLGMFPLQTLATSMTVTINDCSVSVSGDVLREQLLLSQTRDSLMQRTCASKFDMYAWTVDDARAENGVTNAFGGSRDSDISNGSYPIVWVNPNTGTPLNQFDAYSYQLASGTTVTVPVINWKPAFIPWNSNLIGQTIPSSSLPGGSWLIGPTLATVVTPVMYRFQSTEPLCISPFLWQDSKQMTEVGLYGITNMTVNMTLGSPGPVQGYDKSLTGVSVNPFGRIYYDKINNAYGSYQYMTRQSGINALFGNTRLQPPISNMGNQLGPWVSAPKLLCTFLTPPPEITLPLVSSVPYVEFPRYNSSASAALTTAGTVQVSSNTVTLSSIPDLLVVWVRPAFRGQTQGDTYIPITNIGVTFDNYANLCSNYSQEDLYACSVAGGLDMDFNQFRGFARGRNSTSTPLSSGVEGAYFDTFKSTAPYVQLTGSPIVLRMGQDIPLSSGLAPGTLGNYSVQVQLTLDNTNGFFNYLPAVAAGGSNVIITIMGVNSGFFESVRGSSALRKTILNTNDVEAASSSSSVTSSQLVRLVGGASGMHTSSRLTTSLGMPQFKPAMGDEQRVRKMARHSGSMIS